MRADKVQGCLFGLAFGDALAAPCEFLSYSEIRTRWPPGGPSAITAEHHQVTDDTQMTLAVGEALLALPPDQLSSVPQVEAALRRAFTQWLIDPGNTRAPGMTCLQACERLATGQPWLEATISSSKGCGANMRVASIGLLPNAWPGMTPETRSALAQFQAALTHGHPTALAASDLTAFTITYLTEGRALDTLLEHSRAHAQQQRQVYHRDWLGELWQQPGMETPEMFIARGWDECLGVIERVEQGLKEARRDADPCVITGAGWVAEEAYATGLLCFLLYADDPVAAIRHAAVTSGDSDSIACLTGAFAGAWNGARSWPSEWFELIEYRERLAAIATALIQ